jgi:hypothetical protein
MVDLHQAKRVKLKGKLFTSNSYSQIDGSRSLRRLKVSKATKNNVAKILPTIVSEIIIRLILLNILITNKTKTREKI